MAHKQEFTQAELLKMSKHDIVSLAQSLHFNVQGDSKGQLIKLILGQAAPVTSETKIETEPETVEVFEDTTSTVQDTKPKVPAPQQITTRTQEQL